MPQALQSGPFLPESGSSLAIRTDHGDPDTAKLVTDYVSRHLSPAELARIHNTTVPTVKNRLQRFFRTLGSTQQVHAYRLHEGDILDAIRWRIVQLLSEPDRLAKATVKDLAIVFGIMFDKTRLLRGQSTQNISIRTDAILLAHKGGTDRVSTDGVPDLVLPPGEVHQP